MIYLSLIYPTLRSVKIRPLWKYIWQCEKNPQFLGGFFRTFSQNTKTKNRWWEITPPNFGGVFSHFNFFVIFLYSVRQNYYIPYSLPKRKIIIIIITIIIIIIIIIIIQGAMVHDHLWSCSTYTTVYRHSRGVRTRPTTAGRMVAAGLTATTCTTAQRHSWGVRTR